MREIKCIGEDKLILWNLIGHGDLDRIEEQEITNYHLLVYVIDPIIKLVISYETLGTG